MTKMNGCKADSLTDVSSNISSTYEAMVVNLKFNKRIETDQKLIKKRKHSVDSHNRHRTRSSSNRQRYVQNQQQQQQQQQQHNHQYHQHRANKITNKTKNSIKFKRDNNLVSDKSDKSSKSNGSDKIKRERARSVWADESEVSRYTGPIINYKPEWPDNPANIKYTKPNTPTRPSRRMPDRLLCSFYNSTIPQSKSDYSDESMIIREKPPIPPLGGHSVSPKLTSPTNNNSKSIPFPRKLFYESFWGRQIKNLDLRNVD